MVGGSLYYNTDRVLRKEYFKLKAEQKKQEKREAWLRELEARDQEDKEWREKMGKMRVRQREEAEAELADMAAGQVKGTGRSKEGPIAKAVNAVTGNGGQDGISEEQSTTKALQRNDGKDGEGGEGPVTKAVKGLKEKV